MAFVVGAATLGAEIAAARLLAPWFGASTIVWANTIATVLVALAIGYRFGGRLADRDPTLTGLGRIVLGGGLLLAVVPFVAGPFLSVSVSALDEVEAGAFAGSLIAVLVLLAAPVLVLGCVAPYAVRLSVTDVSSAGTESGRLYAISTVGSLAGTFLATLLLIPATGTRRTFLVFALACVLVSIPALRRRAAGIVLALVCAGLLFLPAGTVKAADGERVLWEGDTEYQYARVVEASDGERRLELNEGLAIHSLLPADRGVLTGNYWDEPLVLPAAVLGRPPRSLAVLGGAAGTIPRAYGRLFPETRVDSVEIDGELTDVGRRLFDLRGENLHTHTADARPWLRRSERRFETIFIDAYRQPYIPFYLTTREFFLLCRDRLEPGGAVIINVGHPSGSDELEKALSATLASVFTHVARDAAQSYNTQLIATLGPAPSGARLRAALRAGRLPEPLTEVAGETAGRLAPALTGGPVWTDDQAPVEWLIDGSIVEVAAQGAR